MQALEPIPSSSGRNVVAIGSQAIQPSASSSGSNVVAVGNQAVEPAPSSSGRSKYFKKKHKKQVRKFGLHARHLMTLFEAIKFIIFVFILNLTMHPHFLSF